MKRTLVTNLSGVIPCSISLTGFIGVVRVWLSAVPHLHVMVKALSVASPALAAVASPPSVIRTTGYGCNAATSPPAAVALVGAEINSVPKACAPVSANEKPTLLSKNDTFAGLSTPINVASSAP